MNIDNPLQLGHLVAVLAIILSLVIVIQVYRVSSKSARLVKEAHAALIKRLEENPNQLKRIELSSNEPQQVTVQLIDGTSQLLRGIFGAEAIILYEKLKSLAPHAESAVLENGRPVKAK